MSFLTSDLAKKPYLIGLTGNIGSGKSTAARFFEEEGIPSISSDAIVHKLYNSDKDLQEFLTLSTNATVYAGNTITQLSTGASGVVAANSVGTTITLWAANVSGAFSANISANTYVYRNGANLSAKTTDISYNAVDGTGLAGSNTAQAVFIRGY